MGKKSNKTIEEVKETIGINESSEDVNVIEKSDDVVSEEITDSPNVAEDSGDTNDAQVPQNDNEDNNLIVNKNEVVDSEVASEVEGDDKEETPSTDTPNNMVPEKKTMPELKRRKVVRGYGYTWNGCNYGV